MEISVRGYEGLYTIDELGRVYSVRKQGSRGGEITSSISTGGYCRVYLCKDGKHHTYLLHRLVAQHFIENPENKPCVNHIDGNKSNNSVTNLEWCTYSENMQHAVGKGLNAIPNLKGELHPQSKLTVAGVKQIRERYKNGETPPSLAKEYGVTRAQIYNIIHFKHWRNIEDLEVG
jgi:hypothetical protein